MKADGYNYPDPNTLLHTELPFIDVNGSSSSTPSSAQIAAAEADASCTQSTDLAGIYFSVQADYEQQIVGADAQQLTVAVQRYRSAYQKELANLPTLLTTGPTTPPANGPG